MKRDNKSVVHQVLRERFKATIETSLARRKGWCPQCHIPMLNIQNEPSGDMSYRCPKCGKDYINFNMSAIIDIGITARVKDENPT